MGQYHYDCPLDNSCNEALPRALHPDACLAAIAADCARQQNRFWEYHDRLFENQHTLDRESLFRYARDVGRRLPLSRAAAAGPDPRQAGREKMKSHSLNVPDPAVLLIVVWTHTAFLGNRGCPRSSPPPTTDHLSSN